MNIPPGPLSAADATRLSRLLSQLEGLVNMTTSPGINLTIKNNSAHLALTAPARILAKLTGHERSIQYYSEGGASDPLDDEADSCRYSWEQVRIDKEGCVEVLVNGGMRGFVDNMPAVAITGVATLSEGTIVEMWLGEGGDHWEFNPGGAGSDDLIIDVVTCVQPLVTTGILEP